MTCEKLIFVGVLIFLVVAGIALLIWVFDKILTPKTGAKVLTPFMFSPQKDITAYELSKLLALIINKRDAESLQAKVDALPKHIKRHITDRR